MIRPLFMIDNSLVPAALVLGALVLHPLKIEAADPDQNRIRAQSLAISCQGCHGSQGLGQGTIPAISGLEKHRFLERMASFRNPDASTSVMHRIASSYSEEEWALLQAFFSDRPPN